MPLTQRIAKYAYLCLMALGALIAVLGVLSAIRSIQPNNAVFPGSRWWDHPVLQSGGTGLVLLLTTFAFFAVFIRRGTHLFAPLAYVASYAANAVGLAVVLVEVEKRGAPGPRLTIEDACATAAVWLAPALLVTAAALVWNYKTASCAQAL
jgi:hypothetical protein